MMAGALMSGKDVEDNRRDRNRRKMIKEELDKFEDREGRHGLQ